VPPARPRGPDTTDNASLGGADSPGFCRRCLGVPLLRRPNENPVSDSDPGGDPGHPRSPRAPIPRAARHARPPAGGGPHARGRSRSARRMTTGASSPGTSPRHSASLNRPPGPRTGDPCPATHPRSPHPARPGLNSEPFWSKMCPSRTSQACKVGTILDIGLKMPLDVPMRR